MRTVYAIQFEIRSTEGSNTEQELADLQQTLASWVEVWYGRNAVSTSVIFDGETRNPREGHTLYANRQAASGHTLITLAWAYPHSPDPTVLWQTECTVASDGTRIELAVAVRISSVGFVVKPVSYALRRPRLVADLMRKFRCCAGQMQLSLSPLIIDAVKTDSFVEQVLKDQTRPLPVVVVSPDLWTDRPPVDPESLQDQLAGLAIVAALKDKWAAFKLTDKVGKDLSCFNGAARVYWPGFSEAADWHDHPLFLQGAIHSHQERGRPLSEYLFRHFSAISAFRFMEGSVVESAKAALSGESRRQLEELREKARRGGVSVAETKDMLAMAFEENARLVGENTDLKERNHTLSQELDGYRANMNALWKYQLDTGEADIALPEEGESSEREPENVSEALDSIATQCQDILDVWDTARDSARASGFARPEQAMRALLAVSDLGREFFKAQREKRSMGSWETFFTQRGFKYAAQESQNTLTMYAKDRDFSHKGRKVHMLKHLTIGGGDRVNCLQIYFEPDEAAQRILIGYCGEHLPYYGQRT